MEELIVRAGDGGGSLRVIGGAEGRVAVIRWYSSEDELVGEVYAGSTVGMVLENKDPRWLLDLPLHRRGRVRPL